MIDSRNCTLKTKYSKPSGTGGRKIPKTLLGIETKEIFGEFGNIRLGQAGKYLKPY